MERGCGSFHPQLEVDSFYALEERTMTKHPSWTPEEIRREALVQFNTLMFPKQVGTYLAEQRGEREIDPDQAYEIVGGRLEHPLYGSFDSMIANARTDAERASLALFQRTAVSAPAGARIISVDLDGAESGESGVRFADISRKTAEGTVVLEKRVDISGRGPTTLSESWQGLLGMGNEAGRTVHHTDLSFVGVVEVAPDTVSAPAELAKEVIDRLSVAEVGTHISIGVEHFPAQPAEPPVIEVRPEQKVIRSAGEAVDAPEPSDRINIRVTSPDARIPAVVSSVTAAVGETVRDVRESFRTVGERVRVRQKPADDAAEHPRSDSTPVAFEAHVVRVSALWQAAREAVSAADPVPVGQTPEHDTDTGGERVRIPERQEDTGHDRAHPAPDREAGKTETPLIQRLREAFSGLALIQVIAGTALQLPALDRIASLPEFSTGISGEPHSLDRITLSGQTIHETMPDPPGVVLPESGAVSESDREENRTVVAVILSWLGVGESPDVVPEMASEPDDGSVAGTELPVIERVRLFLAHPEVTERLQEVPPAEAGLWVLVSAWATFMTEQDTGNGSDTTGPSVPRRSVVEPASTTAFPEARTMTGQTAERRAVASFTFAFLLWTLLLARGSRFSDEDVATSDTQADGTGSQEADIALRSLPEPYIRPWALPAIILYLSMIRESGKRTVVKPPKTAKKKIPVSKQPTAQVIVTGVLYPQTTTVRLGGAA